MLVCLAIVSLARGVAEAAVTMGFVDAGQRFAVQRAVAGAGQRLAVAACGEVLGDFMDVAGTPLAVVGAGTIGAQRFDLLRFVDARDAPRCRAGSTIAFTAPGARVVHVCGRRFRALYEADPARAEIIIIHELLHTLGLGENPPSSEAITAQVVKRCRT